MNSHSDDRLSDLYRNLGNSLELEEVLATLDRELRRLIPYDTLSVFLVQEGAFVPAYATSAGKPNATLFSGPNGHDILQRATKEGQPALQHFEGDPDRTGLALIFPLGQAVLVLHRSGGRDFPGDDFRLLHTLSPKLSACIENAERYRRVEQLAEVDPLTGLANVRSLFQRLDAELARARRGHGTLAVLQCSVDGFDRSARLCSADASRRAFEQVAQRLRENCREYDFVARSGEDLVVVLPGFGSQFLAEKCELIQRIVEDIGSRAGLPLFASLGAAFYPEDGTDAEDLLAIVAQRVTVAKFSPPATNPSGLQ